MRQTLSFDHFEAKPSLHGWSRLLGRRKERGQRGSMLIDVALALTVATIALTGQFAQTNEAVDESIAKATGQWAVEYQGALNAYYSTNGQTIMAGQSVAGVASPYMPAVTELINLGYLPAGFSSKAPNGQSFTTSVSQVNVGGTPSLAGYMYSTTPYEDGAGAVRNDLAGLAMQAAGADAGMSTPGHAGQLIGTGNGWQASIAGVPVGTFAMRVGSYADMDAMLSQFYMLNGSRALTGPMNANNNSMSNVSTFGATGNITTSGGTFEATNAPNGIGVQIGNAQLYGDGSNVALRAPNAAYIQTTTGGWAALNAGDLNANGNATILGSATVNGTTVLNGENFLYGPTVVNGFMYMGGGASVQTQLPLAATAVAGQACSGNAITTDPSGNILACQSGVWDRTFEPVISTYSANTCASTYTPIPGTHKYC
ncbi:hypothetical protein, partial [Paraburkholderia humisilvae]|uniref:hypothetical protein n=1 Tax=Paraburkholderia humisilvae TaxID=627669 RepID=UPI001583E480